MQCKTRPTFEPSYSLSSALMERPSEFQFLMEIFREAFRESPFGRLLRAPVPAQNPVANIQYPPAEEIISRSVHNHGHPIPPGFGEIFLKLPGLMWKNIMKQLTAIDLRNMSITSPMFNDLISRNRSRARFPMMQIDNGRIVLIGTERARVYRNHSTIEISHDELIASLQTIANRMMLIRQEGKLEAVSFHIPLLKCSVLQIQVVDPVNSEEEDELAEILEQINENTEIDSRVGLLVRSENNRDALRQRLQDIASRNRRVSRENFNICVVPP